MATVYVVTTGEYSDYGIAGLFSTREGAERLKAELGYDSDIEEYELDSRSEDVRRPTYTCWMDSDGNAYSQGVREEVGPPRQTESWADRDGRCFHGKSTVSPEHAAKLAAEARQKWLREQAVGVVGG